MSRCVLGVAYLWGLSDAGLFGVDIDIDMNETDATRFQMGLAFTCGCDPVFVVWGSIRVSFWEGRFRLVK